METVQPRYMVKCNVCKSRWAENAHIYKVGITHECWIKAPFFNVNRSPSTFPAFMRIEAVNGKYNAAIKCDARCTHATRKNCSCSCGGANHGGH